MSKKLTPPLKWAGGKRWLIPRLQTIYDKFQGARIVEPFVGGLSVTLGLSPKKALLNDINPHLINFYNQLKSGLKSEIDFIYDREYYAQIRDNFNSLIQSNQIQTKEAALFFYYLNRSGFNGLCRFNSKGFFNVPFGKYSNVNYIKDFSEYSEVLQKYEISCDDFEKLQITTNDFLYVDPPYDVEFTQYSKENFVWEDQKRLANWLNKQTCPVIVSNQGTERIIELYKSFDFNIEIVSAPRRISSNGNRDSVNEVLATKNI